MDPYSLHNGINELGPRSRGTRSPWLRSGQALVDGGRSAAKNRSRLRVRRRVGQETVGSFERGGSEETNEASAGILPLRRPLARTGYRRWAEGVCDVKVVFEDFLGAIPGMGRRK